MKKMLVRGTIALIAAAAFGAAGAASPSVAADPDRTVASSVLREALTFDRNADLTTVATADFASLATTERKCRFTSSRNPLRVRSNECRLT
jgi:uncharacterized protein (DUF849 family)